MLTPKPAAHTPTPWKSDGQLLFSEKDGISKVIVTCHMRPEMTMAEALENAAFIVRAVNAHEELLETLKYITQYIVDVDGDSQNGTVVLSTESWNAILETIAKAEASSCGEK